MWINIEQNTDEWLQMRLGKITASNFGLIMSDNAGSFGYTAQAYALQLALERINDRKSYDSFSNKHTERGHLQEPIARALYEKNYFTKVSNGGFFDHGFYGDSPDGLVGTNGVIEIKSVIPKTHYATLIRNNYDPTYKWQIVGHLDCSSRDWCDFISHCSFFPDDKQLVVYRIYREQVEFEIKIIAERREEFNHFIEEVKQKIMNL